MTRSRPQFRIRRVSRDDIFWASRWPWLFTCTACGQKHHHARFEMAIQHTDLHDCHLGSRW